MGWTIIALIPALIAQILFWGWGPLLNVFIACVAAVAAEALCLSLRRRPVSYTLLDGSALLSGMILALSLPPGLSLGLVVFGVVFAMVFGKHVFGGVGVNPFNPAMLGYIMLLLSFPIDMTQWLEPRLFGYLASPELVLDKLPFVVSGGADAYSSPTALDSFRVADDFPSWFASFTAEGGYNSRILPYIILSVIYMLGGLFILYMRIITWHIPLSFLCGLLLPAALFGLFSSSYPPLWFHLVMGGTVFGAFFVATDPVSAATNRVSKLVYGLGIGLFIFAIRSWGGYADAVAFAVLFFNFVAPFIDKYLKPRVYGR